MPIRRRSTEAGEAIHATYQLPHGFSDWSRHSSAGLSNVHEGHFVASAPGGAAQNRQNLTSDVAGACRGCQEDVGWGHLLRLCRALHLYLGAELRHLVGFDIRRIEW